MKAAPSFSLFWVEHRKHVISYTIKFIWAFPLILLLGGFLTMAIHAIFPPDEVFGFYKFRDLLVKQNWVDLYPRFLYGVFLGYVICLPIIHLSVLYLEWDKYKKDRPSDFTHGKCEGPPGYTRRLKWVNASLWDIAGQSIPAIDFGNQRKRYEGAFSEDELLSSLRRKFARTENKPVEDSESLIRWRIVQNNGQEVHIDLQRQDAQPTYWVMTTKFHEWAGRNLPPRLVDIHHTEFVAMGSKIKI